MLTNRSILVALLTTTVLLTAATAAPAHIFCVGVDRPGCTGPIRPATEAGLIQAFSDAQADNDTYSIVSYGAPNAVAVDTPISVAATHPITFKGVHESGIDANIEWTGGSGTFLTIDNAAAGKRGYVEQVGIWTEGDSTALRVKSTNVIWSNFAFGPNPPGSTPTGIVAEDSNISGGRFQLGGDDHVTRGISVVGPDVDVDYVRFDGMGNLDDKSEGIVQTDSSAHVYSKLKFSGIGSPMRVERGTMHVVNSLIQLGAVAGAAAAAASDTSGAALLKLGAVTIAGGGPDQTALRAESDDPGNPAHVQIDSTLVDLRGSGALFATCGLGSGGTGVAGVDATYSLFPMAPESRSFDAGCDSGAIDGPTNIDGASHPPIYKQDGRPLTPAAGSPVIDAGNPVPGLAGETSDLDGYARLCSASGAPRMDIGAYENTDACPIAPWSRPDFDDDSLVPDIDRATGTFRSVAHPRGLRVVRKRPKGAHFTVRAERATGVTFVLIDKPSNRALKGRATVRFPSGKSYLVFDGLWNHKRLASGHYRLRGRLSDNSTFALGLRFRR